MARSPGHPAATTSLAGAAYPTSSALRHTPALAVARTAPPSWQMREGVLSRPVRAGMGLVLRLAEQSIGAERAQGAGSLTGAGTPAQVNQINGIGSGCAPV